MASAEDHPTPTSHENNQKNKKQRRRGPTTAKYITKDDDGPYALKWNEHGVAVGEFKDRYTAYTGAMTRAKVKICIEEWSKVDDDVKEKLWEATKDMFKCDDDKKTYVLRDCKTKWKDFKSRLTHDYFTTQTKNEAEHPPWDAYVGIDYDDWLLFKQQREDDKFKTLSERNRSNQKKNDHPHRLGRGGYSKREEQHAKEQMKSLILSGASTSGLESDTSTVRMVTPRPRYERWIDGRTNKQGDIPNPKTKLVANKIYELLEAEKSGEFVSQGSHDILTEALGTPERGGYVRGLGGRAKLGVVFKRKRRSGQHEGTMTLSEVSEFALQLTQQVREQTRNEMKEVTLEILKSCGVQIPQDMEENLLKIKHIDDGEALRLTNRSSCHSVDPQPDPFANGSKEPKPCELSVLDEDVGYRVVAKGTLLWSEPGEIIHNVPLRDDHVKVCFKQVLKGEENTALPVPFFGHDVLGDEVVGSWAQWPRKQVKVLQEDVTSPQPKRKNKEDVQVALQGMDYGSATGYHCKAKANDADEILPFLLSKSCVSSLPRSCKELYNLFKGRDIDFNEDVPFDDNIFHYPNQESIIAYVGGDDLRYLLNMEWLSMPCLQIWIRFLQNEITSKKLNDAIGFFCPQRLGLSKNRPTMLSSYLAHSISKQSTKQYILAPFKQEHHWMLVVICVQKGVALFFDSSGGGLENVQLKGPLSVAYRTLNLSHGARKSLSWKVVDCPKQPGGVECGYYVMINMRKIVSLVSQNESNLQKEFSTKPYSQAEVDDMREIWCRYFIDQCL